MSEFIIPEFLQGQGVEEIHARMMQMLPKGWDKSEGQFPWEFTRPTASEKAEFVEFVLTNAIKAIFPMWADGQILDYHAQCRGLTRRTALAATGFVQVKGVAGTEIKQGFKFTTPATYDAPGIVFVTDVDVVLEDGVTANIPVTAETAGKAGNVAAGAITLMDSPMNGIESITNSEATGGGIDEETDESLRDRVVEYDVTQGISFVGSVADYRRWSFEVENVGAVNIQGAQDDSGTVTIVLSDIYGNPADDALCKAVYDHIMSPNNPEERLAPVNVKLVVVPHSSIQIAITAAVVTDGVVALSEVEKEFYGRVKAYYEGITDSVVRYTEIGGLLLDCAGVIDYENLLVNGAARNVVIGTDEMARTELTDIALSGVS